MLLVTGVTGHSGKYFLKELIKNNYTNKVRCVIRHNSDTSLIDNSGLNIEKIAGSLEDKEFVDKVTADVDTIIHIASIFYSTNIIDAAIKNNVRKVILVHTTGIYSKYKSASSEYKKIENEIDNLVTNSGADLNIIYLRPTMIFGNINDRNMIVFIKMIDKLRIIPIINNGEGLLQPVNGRDLGKAYFQILCNENILNEDYILSGEKPISMIDMFKEISEILNKKTAFVSVPLSLGVLIARLFKIFSLGKVDIIEKVQRMAENRNFSYEKANEDFGYIPMPFREGLKIEIEEYLLNKQKVD